jgi:hypothetical protein
VLLTKSPSDVLNDVRQQAMNAHDRCDRCNAQAYVETIHSGNSMFWCAHHYNKFEHWLAQAVYRDERPSRTAEPVT